MTQTFNGRRLLRIAGLIAITAMLAGSALVGPASASHGSGWADSTTRASVDDANGTVNSVSTGDQADGSMQVGICMIGVESACNSDRWEGVSDGQTIGLEDPATDDRSETEESGNGPNVSKGETSTESDLSFGIDDPHVDDERDPLFTDDGEETDDEPGMSFGLGFDGTSDDRLAVGQG